MKSPRRYLWTDAFAVCNFLDLHRRTGHENENKNKNYLTLAKRLVEQVHHILGRHREDDSRRGWISGLSEHEGEEHPTRGGLRIGKPLNERKPHERPNSELEWEQDGQYFHYLTKWMHALHRMSSDSGEMRYHRWAAELAVVACQAFTRESFPGRRKQLVWKMSIDLSRPLVSSMGQHDPLDGLITFLELQTAGDIEPEHSAALAMAIEEMDKLCSRSRWATDDPLGIGGLLDNATRLTQLVFEYKMERYELLQQLLTEAALSLEYFGQTNLLQRSAEQRLAFRELGLSIGLQGLPRISPRVVGEPELAGLCHRLQRYQPLGPQIQAFWSEPTNRASSTWTAHRHINTVMLATSLAPDGYLTL
jgi:hypothetical protein